MHGVNSNDPEWLLSNSKIFNDTETERNGVVSWQPRRNREDRESETDNTRNRSELQHILAISPAVRNSLFSKTVTNVVVVAVRRDVDRVWPRPSRYRSRRPWSGRYCEEASNWDWDRVIQRSVRCMCIEVYMSRSLSTDAICWNVYW